jgi:predicted transposase YbfD/YdcC
MRMQTHPKLSLIEHFKDLPDPRVQGRTDHDLIDVLIIAVCTLLCGGTGFDDMADFGKAKQDWFKTFLTLRHGIPSHDTFNRVFAALKPTAFLDCFLRWTQSLRQALTDEIVALDGKALRRAGCRGQSARYIVSAWAQSNGLVLGQLKVADKSNEITALPQLLRVLELAGCIVTVDAMGCQKGIAQEIIEADADYVLALKGNQETVHEEVKSYLDDAIVRQAQIPVRKAKVKPIPELAYTQTVEKDHGRLEIRRHWQSGRLDWFADRSQWEGLRSVGVVESVRQVGSEEPTVERRYYLSSLAVDVQKFAQAVRGHWSVENSLHWCLDVQMGEDQSRARTGHAAENLATLRRLVLNLLKRDKTKKRGLKGKQLNASWDHDYLLRLLAF